MTQLDDLQAYVNFELPRRSVLLTNTITSWDDDPNDGGAPAILKGAPLGTWFYEETADKWWRKISSGATDWQEQNAGGGSSSIITETALTFAVDFNEVTAVDPPAGTVFTTQTAIDAFLTNNSALAFKHLQPVLDSIPLWVRHAVLCNVASGIQRPKAGQGTTYAWNLTSRFIDEVAGGSIEIAGTDPSTWSAFDSLENLTIDTIQAGSDDPYLDFSSSHPLVFQSKDIEGKHVRTSTGQINVIHKHTDDRLFGSDVFSGSPTTATITRPDTLFRNSIDDLSDEYTFDFLVENIIGSAVTIRNIRFDLFNQGQVTFSKMDAEVKIYDCEIDSINHNANAKGLFFIGVAERLLMYRTAINAPKPADSPQDIAMSINDSFLIGIFGCYFQGWEDGVTIQNSVSVEIRNSVFNQVGKAGGGTLGEGALSVGNSGLALVAFGGAKTCEFRDIAKPALYLSNITRGNDVGSNVGAPRQSVIRFTNCTGACIVVDTKCYLEWGNEVFGKSQMIDGTGNLDVGLEFRGAHSSVEISDTWDVTGANGDFRLSEGSITDYATIRGSGPVTDVRGNVVEEIL